MTTSKQPALIDTNVLVYAADITSPFYKDSKAIRDKGLKGDISLCVCPQILNEFYAIVTDQKRVAKALTQKEALKEIEKYYSNDYLIMIYPGVGIIEKTLELLKKYRIEKQDIFDTHLAATMLLNDVKRIYTYNQEDFSRFKELSAIKP